MHEAERFIRQIVEQIGRPSYMQEFLKQGKDRKAVEGIAEKLKEFSENMSLLQPIVVRGFMVPSGSLMLYRCLQEDLDAIEGMLREGMAEAGTGQRERCRHGRKGFSDRPAANGLPAGQKEEMQKRVGIVKHRILEMTEALLPQHIADQIELRTDETMARSAFQEHGFLPLYVDEKTMGIVYNTLTMQLLLDRFNLIFEGVFAPLDQETIKTIMAEVLAPFWRENAQSILFSMETQTENPKG